MQGNKGGSGIFADISPSLNGMHGHDVHAIAAPLSAGNNANSNAAGRRREDDENLVALQSKGYNHLHASTQEANAREVLRLLQKEVGAEAFAEWGSRILDSLPSKEVLRQALYGAGVRCKADEARPRMDDGSLPRTETVSAGPVRSLWEYALRSPSQRLELAEQLAKQLRASVSQLPHERTQMQVRRLTPIECERLMGFPDNFTLVPYRNKPAADGPRYKALGNSMAVPVMRWLGERIQMVEDLA